MKEFQDLMIRTLVYAPPIDVNDITKALSTWKVEEKTEFFAASYNALQVIADDFGMEKWWVEI